MYIINIIYRRYKSSTCSVDDISIVTDLKDATGTFSISTKIPESVMLKYK